MSLYNKLKSASSYGIINALFSSNKPDKLNPFLTKDDLPPSIGAFANSGWTNNATQMAVTMSYQNIIGPTTLRFSSYGLFENLGLLYPAIKYVGKNGARIRLELMSSQTGSGSTYLTFGIFKNDVLIADSEFQTPTTVSRSFGGSITFEENAQKGDVFTVKVLNSASNNITFRYLSFTATI